MEQPKPVIITVPKPHIPVIITKQDSGMEGFTFNEADFEFAKKEEKSRVWITVLGIAGFLLFILVAFI